MRSGDLAYGALAGVIVGILAGATTARLLGLSPPMSIAGVAALSAGLLGAAISRLEKGGDSGDSSTGIRIGMLYGVIPGVALFLQGLGNATVARPVSIQLLIGLLFTGPMVGLLVGAVLDRAREAYLRSTGG